LLDASGIDAFADHQHSEVNRPHGEGEDFLRVGVRCQLTSRFCSVEDRLNLA